MMNSSNLEGANSESSRGEKKRKRLWTKTVVLNLLEVALDNQQHINSLYFSEIVGKEVSKTEINNRLLRLKVRYKKNIKTQKKESDFSDEYEKSVFNLSHKIWGQEEEEEEEEENLALLVVLDSEDDDGDGACDEKQLQEEEKEEDSDSEEVIVCEICQEKKEGKEEEVMSIIQKNEEEELAQKAQEMVTTQYELYIKRCSIIIHLINNYLNIHDHH
ncbi:hypothetical protein M5689_019991 [Euphorbia peplus]|nr:hypothetical protein M5689_019991 [Euphorbia peplus]